MSFLTRNAQMSGAAQQTRWKLVKYSLNSFIHLFFQICLSGIMQDRGRLHSYQLEAQRLPLLYPQVANPAKEQNSKVKGEGGGGGTPLRNVSNTVGFSNLPI